MSEESGEKSQDPTPHRRQQAREEGQVVQSQDLTSAALLLCGLLVLLLAGGSLINVLTRLLAHSLGGEPWLETDPAGLAVQFHTVLRELAGPVLAILGTMLALAIAANMMQVGLLFLPDKLMPDFTRLDPLAGMRRIFSLSNLVRLGFGIFKIIIVGSVAGFALYARRDEILGLAALEIPQIALFTWQIVFWTCVKIGIALAVLAILDYAFQRWKFEHDLRMTPQEVREEMRNLQGDPQVIARRRNVQRQLALNRLNKAVPKADVVVTNPTELAIAIQYDPDTMNAPVVVAKGAGVIAQRIRRLALENGIPIIERKPLAQALYRDVDLNRPIPDQQYAAVAEILAYVYKLNGKTIPGVK